MASSRKYGKGLISTGGGRHGSAPGGLPDYSGIDYITPTDEYNTNEENPESPSVLAKDQGAGKFVPTGTNFWGNPKNQKLVDYLNLQQTLNNLESLRRLQEKEQDLGLQNKYALDLVKDKEGLLTGDISNYLARNAQQGFTGNREGIAPILAGSSQVTDPLAKDIITQYGRELIGQKGLYGAFGSGQEDINKGLGAIIRRPDLQAIENVNLLQQLANLNSLQQKTKFEGEQAPIDLRKKIAEAAGEENKNAFGQFIYPLPGGGFVTRGNLPPDFKAFTMAPGSAGKDMGVIINPQTGKLEIGPKPASAPQPTPVNLGNGPTPNPTTAQPGETWEQFRDRMRKQLGR